MAKGKRIQKIKHLIESGNFKHIDEVFELMPPTPVALHLGSNSDRFKKRLHKPEDFRLREIYAMASYFGVPEDTMLQLVHGQYMDTKATKRRTKGKD